MAENEEVLDNETEIEEVVDEDTVDWKERAKKLEEKAIAQRARTKELKAQLSKFQDSVLPDKKDKPEKTQFDDTDHLFLDVKGVPENDREWLFGEVKETGKSLRQILGFNYIQEELKNRKQARSSEQALPGGNNRSGGGSAKDSPEYWLSKIESGQARLMDVPSREIRSKIVEIRKQRDQQGPRFTDNPVV